MNDRHVPHRPPMYRVAAAIWLAVGLGCLAIQILVLFLFQPDKGLLPDPAWLTDPIAGFVIGFLVGAIAFRLIIHSTPWVIAGVALVLVAIAPVIFFKYQALGAFLAAIAIGVASGALWRRAATDSDATLI